MAQNKLYVGNLPFSVSDDELKKLFSTHGEIDEIKIITDRQTGLSRGFSFITFATQLSAESALAMNGEEFNGRKLIVNMAKERAPRQGGRRRFNR